MSAPFYSFDPCVTKGLPCGAGYPYSTKPYVGSYNDIRPCSVCPGGGCSPCPAPVRPCPQPYPAPPVLPCLPTCPPCDLPSTPLPRHIPVTHSVAIPFCQPKPCPPKPTPYRPCPCCCCPPRPRCYPGTPVCCGCRGPCMPQW